MFVSKKDMPEPIRKEKVLGNVYLSNHIIPFLVYVPVVLLSIIYALFIVKTPFLTFLGLFLIATPLWTAFEYFAHRYIFHANPKSSFLKKIVYSIHKGHHEYPNDKRFMLVGLQISIPALFAFYGLFYLLIGNYAFSFMAGWVGTYIFYDWLHFAVHNLNFNNKFYKVYQRHHIEHHFLDNDKNFGFMSLLWDNLFKTRLSKTGKMDRIKGKVKKHSILE